MNRYLLSFSYDGSFFCGFQRQKTVRSVQGDIEDALSEFFQKPIVIKGAGRTDSKVHARKQYAHFDCEEFNKKELFIFLNSNLENIVIKSIKIVDEKFHARFSVFKKLYIYKLSMDKNDDSKYYGIYTYDLDVKALKKCASLFLGVHNYMNFVSGYRDDYTSAIFSIKVIKIKKRIYIIFKGHSFYRYMVRNVVGAMIDHARGKVDIDYVKSMLDTYEEKTLSTAKAEGLYLWNIKY